MGMVNLSAEVSTWPTYRDGWRISPGVEWCQRGSLVKVGEDCYAEEPFRISHRFWVGDKFQAGQNFTAEPNFTAGYGFTVGRGFYAEEDFCALSNFKVMAPFRARHRFWVGRRFSAWIGFEPGPNLFAMDNATAVACVGRGDGKWFHLFEVGGVAYIGTPGVWLPLSEAVKNYAEEPDEYRETLCLLHGANELAHLTGLATV